MKEIFAVSALAALSVSPVYAECTSPGTPPTIADGSSASADDIIKSQQDLIAFNGATTTYLACIKKEHDDAVAAAGPSISSSQADKLDDAESKAQNAAVRQLNDVVNRFNQSVKTFKAKNAAPPPKAAPATDKAKPDPKG